MKVTYFLTLILTVSSCSKHAELNFHISETTIDEAHFDKLKNELLQENDSIIFEDNTYKVRSSCRGEWGGSIWFKNKRTGIEYACMATCPVVVHHLNNKYIITTTLAHGNGFSRVIEIQDPEKMEVFELPEHKKVVIDGASTYYINDLESHSTEGSISLVDTLGILTLSSFKYQNELYHIITDFKSTFISSIVDGRFELVDTLSNKSFWTYGPELIVTKDGHSITFFWNDKVKGYLDIWDNNIELKILE